MPDALAAAVAVWDWVEVAAGVRDRTAERVEEPLRLADAVAVVVAAGDLDPDPEADSRADAVAVKVAALDALVVADAVGAWDELVVGVTPVVADGVGVLDCVPVGVGEGVLDGEVVLSGVPVGEGLSNGPDGLEPRVLESEGLGSTDAVAEWADRGRKRERDKNNRLEEGPERREGKGVALEGPGTQRPHR